MGVILAVRTSLLMLRDLPDDVTDGLSYLESYTYSCMEGFNTTDELCTVCQPDGSLSVTNLPNCTGKMKNLHRNFGHHTSALVTQARLTLW